MTTVREPLIVSFGGGVNSAAMLVGMLERSIKPDLILFADTSGEKPETYHFVSVMSAFCIRAFGVWITHVHASHKTDIGLEANCLRLKVLPSIAYGYRACSQRWKGEPQEKYANHWPPAIAAWADGIKVIKALGIDAGEAHRAKNFDSEKYRCIYPLIEWGWDRPECVAALKRADLPVPGKSACFFCPSSKKAEVLALSKHHPDLFDRAVRMERNAAEYNQKVDGLGRHWSWEDLVKAANEPKAQGDLFPESQDIPCMCFDGDDD